MFLRVIVLDAEVQEGLFYDQRADEKKSGFSVNVIGFDAVTNEKYEIQLTDGYAGFDELRELKRHNASNDQLREAAERLRQELPRKFDQLDLEVLKIKGKMAPYLKLVCRFVYVAHLAEYAQYIQDAQDQAARMQQSGV